MTPDQTHYLAQQEAGPVSPNRSAWIGRHGTEP
jgi:hypothetical protein